MRKTLLVMRQELITTFSRPSYLLFAFGIPVLVVLIMGIVKVIQARSSQDTGTADTTANEYQPDNEGYVDHSGLIETVSENLQGHLFPYDNEEQAQQALEDNLISAYYVIPVDYIDSGDIHYVYPNEKSFLDDGQSWVIKWTLNLNLLNGNQELADQIWNPIWELDTRTITPDSQQGTAVSGDDCSRPGVACESIEPIRMMPSLLVAIFFITFMSSSSMLFNSIGQEKENRTIELLLLSISPRELLSGKTLALGFAGLTQTTAWLVSIYILFNIGGSTLSLPEGFVFPIEILIWGLLFFLGGFGLYASLMAGAGALVPNMKEAGIANFLALFPLFFGYVFGLMAPMADSTDAIFIKFLSFFPLTSPVVMVMRLTDSPVPFWQLLLSIVLLFSSAYFSIQIVAAMFNASNLLSGQPFSVKRYFQALTGRA